MTINFSAVGVFVDGIKVSELPPFSEVIDDVFETFDQEITIDGVTFDVKFYVVEENGKGEAA